jgi:hypothetical protein
LNTT